ncbi:enoyl-CoA hydratase/isomerase family protein [Microvirga pudoricolor]|uniref:enoyl-CoA hydratase/isomerase family protein n=1 Tax=Microvirga pudoricolor TaxID=2778729 RepID=UPI002D21A8FA|nr:enoyl-CoA hydratase-related protein [Microvirga pudoricolor]
METLEPVILSVAHSVATIRLNRPSVLNAIDAATAVAFREAVRVIGSRDDIRVIVLRGEGRAFCAGGDVARFEGEDREAAIDAIIAPLHEGLRALSDLPQPSLAVVQGAAAGAGFSLAIACDLAIAADNAKFTLAYARIGASPDGSATYHLPRLVGLRKAKELALLAETVDAEEAQRIGLVNKVVPLADLEVEAERLVSRLAAGPSLAYGRIRALLETSLDNDLAAQLAAEQHSFRDLTGTKDFQEGVRAFLAKRPAHFQGS